MLNKFVHSAKKLYSVEFMSHNVHNLLHLVDDVKLYGALDQFSAFKFENYIGRVKKFVRKAELPLQQIARRIQEIKNFKNKTSNKSKANVFSRTETIRRAYDREYFVQSSSKLNTPDCTIICNDNCNDVLILKNGNILRSREFLQNKNGEWFVMGNLFRNVSALYVNSLSIHISTVDRQLEQEDKVYPINMIFAKACKLPFNKKFAIIPIIHTFKFTDTLNH